ncbi:MAG: hypothetical protein Sapg2KO_39470 [Saprospiraceae bacterium]
MFELDQEYLQQLEAIATEIQGSEELAKYLDTEEDEDFLLLKDLYEPRIGLIHNEVARKQPLQLIPFELVLLDPVFEGLYLPKILGFSVLRGEVNDNYKYIRPQDHFKEVLLAICQSANFDILKKRIGQSIQIGFSLSSDIWVTNLIAEVVNKKVRYYLQSQKLEKYRVLEERQRGYRRYKSQFKQEVFMTANFPTSIAELNIFNSSLQIFLKHRINLKEDNSSLDAPMNAFIENEAFHGKLEHMKISMLYAYFFKLDDDAKVNLADYLNDQRESDPEFSQKFFDFIEELHDDNEVDLLPEAEQQFSELLDEDIKDELGKYYALVDQIHDKGYLNAEVHEAIQDFYSQNKGVSVVNHCLRQTIYHYFARFIKNLSPTAYVDYFDITKYFPVYMKIFANQQFNQNLKELSMAYVKKLLKVYIDKRGKDYQDIKKFVRTNFVDFGFLTQKQIVDLFKTKRKKKKPV